MKKIKFLLKSRETLRQFVLPVIIGILIGSFFVANISLALETGLGYGTYTGLGTTDLRISIMKVVQVFLGFLGVLAILIVLYGGFVWMTAGGNDEKIEQAKKILINAVIGLVIIFSAFGIVSFIINVLNPLTLDSPSKECSDANSGEISGCYVCNPPSWVFDETIAGCGGLNPNCLIKHISPTGENRPMNSVVKIEFNYDTIANIDSNNFKVVKVSDDTEVVGTITTDSKTAIFMPDQNCSAPWESEKCFESNTKYEIQIIAGSLQCGGWNVVCGTYPCVATFTTGDFIDVFPPTVSLIPTQICLQQNNELKALVDDDGGIDYARYDDLTTPLFLETDFNISVPPAEISTVNWDTTSNYSVGDIINVSSSVIDFSNKTEQDSRDFKIVAQHCCNGTKDGDETEVDCGGQDCESCDLVIEWIYPTNAAPGSMVTIHGRRFGSSGTVTFIGDTQDEQDDSIGELPASKNPACVNSWSETEIITIVPSTAVDGPIKVSRSDSLIFDQTAYNFDVNDVVRPGLCELSPNQGYANTGVTFQGINFIPASDEVLVYFGSQLALGGITYNFSGTTIPDTGGTAPRAPAFNPPFPKEIGSWVKVDGQFSNPITFTALDPSLLKPYECSGSVGQLTCNVGDPNDSLCDQDEYCSSECRCEPRVICDDNLDNNSPEPICDPSQTLCPSNWFCYNSTTHGPDSDKLDCYCYAALSCDGNAATLACETDNNICPTGYFCDNQSNCTCQSYSGIASSSSYAWTFTSGIAPGPCSSDEGMCVPNNTLCPTGYSCNENSCNCELIEIFECTSAQDRLSCAPDNTQCDKTEFCNNSCQCESLVPCDADTATPACEIGECPTGYYCYSEGLQTPDPSKLDCYCYPGIYCDNPTMPADSVYPECRPDNNLCPEGYTCDPAGGCLCQPEIGIADASAYAWTFDTITFRPRVVENCNRTDSCDIYSITSPSPFNREGTNTAGYNVSYVRSDDKQVAIDAVVTVLFDKEMYFPENFSDQVTIYSCGTSLADCNIPVAGTLIANNSGYYNKKSVGRLTFYPDNLLNPNTYYVVDLKASQIFGSNGFALVGNAPGIDDNYRWVFKTKDSLELSLVGCLYIYPPQATLNYYDQRRDDYLAQPSSEDNYCLDIRPESCSLDNGNTMAYSWDIGPGTYGDSSAAVIDTDFDIIIYDNLTAVLAKKETIPDWVSVDAICSTPAGDVSGYGRLYNDFSNPYVIDKFPDCGTACLNAKIGATFSKMMDPGSVTAAIDLYVCYDDPACDLNYASLVNSFIKPTSPDPAEAPNTFTGNVPCYDINGDGVNDYCLLPNTYYRVVIKNTAVSLSENKPLSGLNFDFNNDSEDDSYSWIFKTQVDYGLCLPDRIDVVPADKSADYEQKISYASLPWTAPDACEPETGQRLNPYSWDWDWDTNLISKQFDNPFCSGEIVANFLTDEPVNYCPDRSGQLRDSCGNNFIEPGEDCDDGNLVNDDGCNNLCLNDGSADCGNNRIDYGEECEPANSGYCDAVCLWQGNNDYTLQVCGNLVVESGEECDDGNTINDDGCNSSCLLSGSVREKSLCGDGQIGLGEECDEAEYLFGATPSSGDYNGDGIACSSNCLVENRDEVSFCRSNISNIFDFKSGQCAGPCPSYSLCVQLNQVVGNNNYSGSVCGNGMVETGEECDNGGYCTLNGQVVFSGLDQPIYCNTYGTFCATGQTCQPYDGYCASGTISPYLTTIPCNSGNDCSSGECWRDGCSQTCIHNGSVYEVIDPASVGAYQVVLAGTEDVIQTSNLGNETYIQSWIDEYKPDNRGPLGQGYLSVGEVGTGPRIIDKWPDCGTACVDAAVGGQFDMSMNASTIGTATVSFYECALDSNCDISGKSAINVSVAVDTINTNNPNDTFRIYLPQTYNPTDHDQNTLTPEVPALLPNTYYRVVLSDGIISSDSTYNQPFNRFNYDDPNNNISGNDSYSWIFKTQAENDFCGLDRVDVIPNKLTLPEGGVRYRYFSEPYSEPDSCSSSGQRLNPYYFNWAWDAFDIDGINAADIITPLADGCGNGMVELGEDCDWGLGSYPGCGLNCQWEGTDACSAGTTSGCCGNGIKEVGEECETGDSYCSSHCLWIGNNSDITDICGNNIINDNEECDTGSGLLDNDSDGCSQYCLYTGSIPAVSNESLCGNGVIDVGEECDDNDLAQGLDPASNDGCSGLDNSNAFDCDSVTIKSDCENSTYYNKCWWSGSQCLTRPCLLENRNAEICRSQSNNKFDFTQNSASCSAGYLPYNLNLITGNSNLGVSVCGDGIVESGEECDDSNRYEGYCSVGSQSCQTVNGNCSANGACDSAGNCVLANGVKYDTACSVGTGCSVNGVCISDGCSSQCINNSSTRHDNLSDPYQIVQTVPQGTIIALTEVNEEIRAWHTLQPDRVGVGELIVLAAAEVPFRVIGHQPLHDQDADQLQCRNVAIWAVFSKELKTSGQCDNDPDRTCLKDSECADNGNCNLKNSILGICSTNSDKSCLKSKECPNSGVCQFENLILEECAVGDSSINNYSACSFDPAVNENKITGIEYTTIQGFCGVSGRCEYALADNDNNPLVGSFCDRDSNCIGSKLEVTSLSYDDGFLPEFGSYQLFVRPDDPTTSGTYEGLVSSDDYSLLRSTDGSQRTQWNFSSGDNFCECNYISVVVDNTSGGSPTIQDSFTCARNDCGSNTDSSLDDDVVGAAAGNQHRYNAQCYDIESAGAAIPIMETNITYYWREQSDPDSIIYLSSDGISGLTSAYDLNNVYVTPGNLSGSVGVPAAKNGRAYVGVDAKEYKCSDSYQLCVPTASSPCVLGAGECISLPAASQRIEVINFICDNPWPAIEDGFPYQENEFNLVTPDTNFELYYCRDFGNVGFDDDLPALTSPTVFEPIGSTYIKEFIFPVQGINDALGVRVLKNPLHLSPATWYKSGLCGGVSSFENLCFSDDDCTGINDTNLVGYWGFDEGFGTTAADISGNHNDGAIYNAEWVVDGQIDKALSFNGNDNYIEVADSDSLDVQSDLTIAAWVNFSALGPSGGDILEKFDAYCTRLVAGSGGKSEFYFSIDNGTTWSILRTKLGSKAIAPNTWYYVVGVYDRQPGTGNSKMHVYVNGVEDTGAAFSGGPVPDSINITSKKIRIGKHSGDNYNFKGLIDEVRIYNKALSAEEIKSIYESSDSRTCNFNVPVRGSVKSATVDGYRAVNDGRTVYVGATNLSSLSLFSNIYLISYSQDANAATTEIFNRILDPNQQTGSWYFNPEPEFSNQRICRSIGYFQDTTAQCDLSNYLMAAQEDTYSYICSQHRKDADFQGGCDSDATHGCYWDKEVGNCLAKICEPIYCNNDFECPNLSCSADKEKVVRDNIRFGDLRDMQLLLHQSGYPLLEGGTYIASTTFSIWPSWQKTFAQELSTSLFIDPINLFYKCPGTYYCDQNGNKKIDATEITPCDWIIDSDCPNFCIPQDPDQAYSCWNETNKQFVCPVEAGSEDDIRLFSYAYRAADQGSNYELYTNFEYSGEGNWRAASASSGLYELPLSNVDKVCRPFNFEVHRATISGGTVAAQCSVGRCYGPGYENIAQVCTTSANCQNGKTGVFCSADADADGVCDYQDSLTTIHDNCNPARDCPDNISDCYNPDQRDSGGLVGVGNVCDSDCSADSDGDGICDEYDNCRTVYNPSQPANCVIPNGISGDYDQCDADQDGIGDLCDPCTDLDYDGWWDLDIKTFYKINQAGVNDSCSADNVPAGYCVDPTGNYIPSSSGYGCYNDSQCSGGVCKFDSYFINASNPVAVRGFLSADHFNYCQDVYDNPIETKPCCLSSGQYSPGVCTNSNNCSTCTNGYSDFGTYNPFQEDYDNDQVGYIGDDCIDFDKDNFGDWPFYTNSTDPEDTKNLTDSQKQHFQGCQTGSVQFMPWGEINPDLGIIPTKFLWISNTMINSVAQIVALENMVENPNSPGSFLPVGTIVHEYVICGESNGSITVHDLVKDHSFTCDNYLAVDPSRTAVNVEAGQAWITYRGTGNDCTNKLTGKECPYNAGETKCSCVAQENLIDSGFAVFNEKQDNNGNALVKFCPALADGVDFTGARGIAIDKDGNAWVGGHSANSIYKFSNDPLDGCNVLKTINVDGGVYGMAVDPLYNLWIVQRTRFNTTANAARVIYIKYPDSYLPEISTIESDPGNWFYGLGVDLAGNAIVTTAFPGSKVYKFYPPAVSKQLTFETFNLDPGVTTGGIYNFSDDWRCDIGEEVWTGYYLAENCRDENNVSMPCNVCSSWGSHCDDSHPCVDGSECNQIGYCNPGVFRRGVGIDLYGNMWLARINPDAGIEKIDPKNTGTDYNFIIRDDCTLDGSNVCHPFGVSGDSSGKIWAVGYDDGTICNYNSYDTNSNNRTCFNSSVADAIFTTDTQWGYIEDGYTEKRSYIYSDFLGMNRAMTLDIVSPDPYDFDGQCSLSGAPCNSDVEPSIDCGTCNDGICQSTGIPCNTLSLLGCTSGCQPTVFHFDLDNCPGGPNSKPCYDPEYGFELSCSNSDQNDQDWDMYGDICDLCGNKVIDTGENCDLGIDQDELGFCPDNDNDCSGCQQVVDKNTCQARCVGIADGCNGNCPATCSEGEDPDCSSQGCCGDSVCNAGEDSSNCPADCKVACNDNFDNDGDGYIDYPQDFGCLNSTDTNEYYNNADTIGWHVRTGAFDQPTFDAGSYDFISPMTISLDGKSEYLPVYRVGDNGQIIEADESFDLFGISANKFLITNYIPDSGYPEGNLNVFFDSQVSACLGTNSPCKLTTVVDGSTIETSCETMSPGPSEWLQCSVKGGSVDFSFGYDDNSSFSGDYLTYLLGLTPNTSDKSTKEVNCGNGICETALGENCTSCPTDCLKRGQICCNGLVRTGNCCDAGDCNDFGGNCVVSICAFNTCSYQSATYYNADFCGECGTCNLTDNLYNCTANNSFCSGKCAVCQGADTDFSCQPDHNLCPDECEWCSTSTLNCESVINSQDNFGSTGLRCNNTEAFAGSDCSVSGQLPCYCNAKADCVYFNN